MRRRPAVKSTTASLRVFGGLRCRVLGAFGCRVLCGRYNETSMSRVIPLTPAQPRLPKPDWLKVRAPGSPSYLRLKGLMRELNLHTVCEEARCPNIGECWNHGTATFMILGDVCTRACGYCAVGHGRPHPVDAAEPARVADAVQKLELAHVVVTSVDRDDVQDGGAAMFAETIREIRKRTPDISIEVLIPDFQ